MKAHRKQVSAKKSIGSSRRSMDREVVFKIKEAEEELRELKFAYTKTEMRLDR